MSSHEIIIFAISVILAGVAICRYSFGVWICVALLPLSATYLIGRQFFGITGLNPFNIILVATILSFIVTHVVRPEKAPWPRMPLIFWIFVAMFVFYGIVGCFYIHLAPPTWKDGGGIQYWTVQRYVLEQIGKPLLVVVVTLLVSSLAKSGKVKGLIWAIAISSGIVSIAVIGYVVLNSISLSVLADSSSRDVLSWTGLHANSLGLFLNMSTAVLFFNALGDKYIRGRTILFLITVCTSTATLLTFSRGAFLGLVVIGMYYLMTRKKILELLIAIVVCALGILFVPDAVYDRALTGLDKKDANAISAGRTTVIWPAMLPVFLENPFVGHGLSSTLWTAPRGKGFYFGHPHNAYLASLLDFGVFGSVIVLLLYFKMWALLRRICIVYQNTCFGRSFEGYAVCVILLIVQGITGQTLNPSHIQAWMWIGFGLVLFNAGRCNKGENLA